MNDREMLEWAAKANNDDKINKDIEGYYRIIGRNEDMGCDVLVEWNPLTDDGDALRLAVKLGIEIGAIGSPNQVNCEARIDRIKIVHEINGDPYAATRRAITRAAVEIGKAMEQNNA